MDATNKWNNRTKNSHTYSRSTAYVKKSTYKNIYIYIYIYIYTYIWISLRPRYSRAFKLDPPGTDSHRRTSSPGRSWNCKGSAGSTPSCWRWHAASAKGGSAGGGDGSGMCSNTSETFSTNWAEAGEWHWSPKRGGKEDSFTIYHFSRRATFYLPCNDASNQTIKTIGIDMQLQDLAFESPIWQDPLYLLKARSLHPLDTPKTLTVHHDINRRM